LIENKEQNARVVEDLVIPRVKFQGLGTGGDRRLSPPLAGYGVVLGTPEPT